MSWAHAAGCRWRPLHPSPVWQTKTYPPTHDPPQEATAATSRTRRRASGDAPRSVDRRTVGCHGVVHLEVDTLDADAIIDAAVAQLVAKR